MGNSLSSLLLFQSSSLPILHPTIFHYSSLLIHHKVSTIYSKQSDDLCFSCFREIPIIRYPIPTIKNRAPIGFKKAIIPTPIPKKMSPIGFITLLSGTFLFPSFCFFRLKYLLNIINRVVITKMKIAIIRFSSIKQYIDLIQLNIFVHIK